jgi:hypothetical protein
VSVERSLQEEAGRKASVECELSEWKLSVSSMESDLIILLKNYKEMLNEVFKLQLLAEDVRSMQAILAQM